jgi:arsenite-transporting ATPase
LTSFAFYGGKGGVGKTTCAAARAVTEAGAGGRGRRGAKGPVLVVSTDPAHSLGDALAMTLSTSPKPVRSNLYGVELDARRAFGRWLREHRRALGDVIEHGTWLDRTDVEGFLDVSPPGIDELVGLIEIDRMAGERAYSLVVVDTAPTGHTLRLLSAPDTVAAVAKLLDTLQEEHRLIRERFSRLGRPEAADRLIALMAGQARDASARLRDSRATAFHWVTLPETMSVAESRHAVTALERAGIGVAEIIVNRVLPADSLRNAQNEPCPICDRRRADEARELRAIARTIGRGRRLRVIAAEIDEPRGLTALSRIGAKLAGRIPAWRSLPVRASASRRLTLSLPEGAATVAPASIAALRGARLLFFGGKGGVGKTTAAAAAALSLARAEPKRKWLLLSTDPAHSLADVFGSPIGDTPQAPAGAPRNLAVRELDARRSLASRRETFAAAFEEIATAFGSAVSAAMPSDLLDLAPPGIDELFGVIEVLSARASYGGIVVDTAPTGHALRLLETPAAALDFVHALMRILLKYRSLVRSERLAAELLEMSHRIQDLQSLLRDRSETRFVVVTRAANVPRLETERLLGRLAQLRIAAPAILVNALTLAPGRCARCHATAKAERRERAALRKRAGRRVIIEAPLSAPSPRGAGQLEQWGRGWTTIRQ